MHVAMPGLVDGLPPISYVVLCGVWITTILSIAGLLSNGLRRNRQLSTLKTQTDCLHINVLELIAIIINIWLALVFITKSGKIPGGHIISMLADNTSALSWMRYTSRTKRPVVRELSHFILDLTLSCPIQHKLSGLHIQGILNIGADKLS
jgi:hypothetical protein